MTMWSIFQNKTAREILHDMKKSLPEDFGNFFSSSKITYPMKQKLKKPILVIT